MAGILDGQLWFIANGATADVVTGHVNSDGSNVTQEGVQAADHQSQTVAVDLAAGFYFTITGQFLEARSITNPAVIIDSVQIGNPAGPGTADDDIVNAVAIDPFTHTLYVGLWGQDLAHTGIVVVDYNTSTGALDHNAAYGTNSVYDNNTPYLITNTSTGGKITDVRDFSIDLVNHKLYWTDDDNQYSLSPFVATNNISVVTYNAANPSTTVTQLSSNVQFPTNQSNGIIGPEAVDVAKGLIYFETNHIGNSAATLWYMPTTGGTATQVTLPAGSALGFGDIPQGGISIDPQSQYIFITVQSGSMFAGPDEILQGQLSADGHSITSWVNTYPIATLDGHTPDVAAHIADTWFDQLPVLSSLNGTTTHAVEQGASVTLLTGTPTITDTDGDHLAGATVVIAGGTFSSNETSANDDHLTINGTASGSIGGTNISYSYNAATETLTLTGYDTWANYQSALALVKYNTTGDNPTNYDLNTTRTIQWTVSDGALDVPFGAQNSGSTTLTIDGKNDAPVASAPATYTEQEHVAFNLHNASLNVSDVDGGITGQNETATLSVTEGTLHAVAGTGTSLGVGISGDGTSTLTITGTIAQINGLLNGDATSVLTHTGNVDANDTPNSITLSLSIDDNGFNGVPPPGAQTSNTAQSTISAPDDTSVTFTGLSSNTTGSPVQDQQITATIHDGGTTVSTATYTWKVAGTTVQSSSSNTYTPTESDEGKALTLDVSFNDPNDNSITETDTGIGVGSPDTVQDSADTVVTLGGLDGSNNAVHGTAVTATVTDGGSAVSAATYTWKVAGSTVQSGASNSYTPVEADEGKALTLDVSFTDVGGAAESTTGVSAGTVQEIAGGDTVVALSGLDGSNNAVQGTAVTATVTDGGAAVSAVTYTWKVAGSTVQSGASNSYTPVEADEGKALTVNVSFTDVAGNSETGSGNGGTVQDSADTVVAFSGLTGGNAVEGTAVTVTSITDGGLAVTNPTYQWQRDGVNINGATSASYTPTENDEGHALTVNVGFTDANNNSETGSGSGGTVQEIPGGDTVVTLGGLTAGGNAVEGTAVTASVTDGGSAVSAASYTWKVAGSTVQSGSSNSYTPLDADEGKALTVNVSFTDVAGNSETGSAAGGTVQESPTENAAVALAGLTGGNAVEGQQITAAVIEMDAPGSGSHSGDGIHFTWTVNGSTVKTGNDAFGNNYTPTEADEGQPISVSVSFTDTHGFAETGSKSGGTVQESATESATVALAGLTGGNAVEGQQITASVTEADAPGSGITFTWKVNGSTVKTGVDAAGNTYTPTDTDEGLPISVLVSFTDTHLNAETGSANAGTVQENPNENATIALSGLSGGNAVEGTQITATVTDPDKPAAGITFTWKVNGNTVKTGVDAAGNTYTPAPADDGKPITVSVSFTDTHANAETGTQSAGIVQGLTHFGGSGDYDTDGDRNGDLLWQNSDGSIASWDMNGARLSSITTLAQIPSNWHLAGTGHFFGADGGGGGGGSGPSNTDAVLLSDAGDFIIVAFSGNQIVANQLAGHVPPNWHIAGVGDFNGDGKSDLLWQSNAHDVLITEMNGAQVIVNQFIGPAPGGGQAMAVDDFNGDGKADIVFQTPTGDLVMWEMNGTQIAVNQTVGHLPASWQVAATGDFNADGKADIILASPSGGVVMLEMNGTQILVNQSIAQIPNNWHVTGTGDVNGDGKSDVILTSDAGDHVVWQMNGPQIVSNQLIGPSAPPASPPLASQPATAGADTSAVLATSSALFGPDGSGTNSDPMLSHPTDIAGALPLATGPAGDLADQFGVVRGSGPASDLADQFGVVRGADLQAFLHANLHDGHFLV